MAVVAVVAVVRTPATGVLGRYLQLLDAGVRRRDEAVAATAEVARAETAEDVTRAVDVFRKGE